MRRQIPASRGDLVSETATLSAPRATEGLPFQVRGSLQTILSLRIIRHNDPNFMTMLLDKIAHAPDFFRNAPLVLDVGQVTNGSPEGFADLIARLREHKIIPVGVQNGSESWNAVAVDMGLALFGAGGAPSREPTAPKRPSTTNAAAKPSGTDNSLLIKEPVRGGQQVINPNGDLVIVSAVSAGAEVCASGHIHIYGPLRGRAFAGNDGDENAMIFVDQLEAQLLSIAGIYVTSEQIDERLIGKRARISCDGTRLVLQPLP